MGTALQGNFPYYKTGLSKAVEANVIEWLNWGFINNGAFTNVNKPTSGAYGGDFSSLRKVSDPRYEDGTIWESIRGNWVWESGMAYTPIRISGIWIDDVWTTTGFNVNYPQGRIEFDSSQDGPVNAEYSYKEVQFLSAHDNPVLREISFNSRRIDNADFSRGSGEYLKLVDSRVNLPCVSVEVIGRSARPYELGKGGAKYSDFDIKLYILGEEDYSVSKIADLFVNQDEYTINLFDLDKIMESGAYPLDYRGYLQNGAKTYPQLVAASGVGGYMWTDKIKSAKMRIHQPKSQNGQWLSTNLYYRTVTLKGEMIVNALQ